MCKGIAFTLLPTLLNPQISDAEPGTGLTKFALLALTNGHSMLIRFVFPSPINAKLTMEKEIAPNVSRDMT